MNKANYVNPLFAEMLKAVPEEARRESERSFAIAGRIKEILQRKRWSQADFAKAAGKKEAEISKWMSGTHNFTIRTISFIETVLGEDVISIKRYHRQVSGYGTANADRTVILNDGGNQAEYHSVDYHSFIRLALPPRGAQFVREMVGFHGQVGHLNNLSGGRWGFPDKITFCG